MTGLIVVPGPGSESLAAAGQTVQFKAIATYQTGRAKPTTADVTDAVTWTASNPSVATMSTAGLATATGAGKTTITAQTGGTVASSDVTVAASSASATTQPSLSIIPASGTSISPNIGETTQFVAVGDLNGTGITQDLTQRVHWQSSDVSVATINQAGLATTAGTAATTTTITALATAANGSVLTASSTVTLGTQGSPVALPSLAVYKVGTYAAQGTVNASPNLLKCDAEQTCTGYYQRGQTVTLSVPQSEWPHFGGWSANCAAPGPGAAVIRMEGTTPVYSACSITLNNNEAVGAIFNASTN